MRITEKIQVFPWSKGIDKASAPGAKDRSACDWIENFTITEAGVKALKPGITRIEAVGSQGGYTRMLVDFHGISGGQSFSEVVRVVDGRIEALRNGSWTILSESEITSTDKISYTRFVNRLIVCSENYRVKVISPNGTAEDMTVPSTFVTDPPTICSLYKGSVVYSGRRGYPHTLYMTETDTYDGFLIKNGAYAVTVRDGDGDPVGIVGLSKEFRGDLYAFKKNSIYRLFYTDSGLGIDGFTEGTLGLSAGNSIVQTENDIYWCSDRAIHALSLTADYGAAKAATLTYPIYKWFQKNVNWAAAKYMSATYDPVGNCYLLAFPSSASPYPDTILAINVLTKEPYIYNDQEYISIGSYEERQKQKTYVLVSNSTGDIGYFDEDEPLSFGQPITAVAETVKFIPVRLDTECTFTKAKFYFKPTNVSSKVYVQYIIDGEPSDQIELDTYVEPIGAVIGEAIIGTDEISNEITDYVSKEIDIKGKPGSSIKFVFSYTSSEEVRDQTLEIYGLYFEFEYNEDKSTDKKS